MEGAMMLGLSAALYEHIDIVNGEVQELNFDKYRVLRMADVPAVEIKLIATDNPPTGMGEPGVPGVAPSIANAVAALTGGKRAADAADVAGPREGRDLGIRPDRARLQHAARITAARPRSACR